MKLICGGPVWPNTLNTDKKSGPAGGLEQELHIDCLVSPCAQSTWVDRSTAVVHVIDRALAAQRRRQSTTTVNMAAITSASSTTAAAAAAVRPGGGGGV